ncbi:formimidoylglutamate deiminase [Mangrovimonas sp. ST2L15]|uniref:formimidoylglutamate deiminase n=1 Tax=Mangrovimonas sp. ST2L15 TaxID=1645916 RepID=UPI0006B5E3F5|nr:formimidoylglutamate deiminase [Mangrovimonas sp. ST2L15]
MSKAYRFHALLTETGWLTNAVVTLNENGCVLSIKQDDLAQAENINGFALPGFQNAHSHAFQYAMAGLAELHEGSGQPDDFWSWRSAMYDLALQVSPEHLEAIATMLYSEMLRHGYTSVAEFHYVHHDPDGNPYSNLAELGSRLISAAQTAGIQITLVPMFYQKGGFGKEAESKQKRFISKTIEDYYRLFESSEKAAQYYDQAKVGLGIHSLRAVTGEDIIQVGRNFGNNRPFHIHVSEQIKEIEDCKAFYQQRPVEWLLNNMDLNPNYHLVHATHLNDDEVKGIATSGAHVVLCPTTEGNLGDGLFRFHDYKALNGSWSIGTDSHIGISPMEELRLLDYGQRLTTHKRNTFYLPYHGDSGLNAITMAYKAGRQAMGRSHESFFEIGQPFNTVIFDANSPLMAATNIKHICNSIVYASDVSHILGTMVEGEWITFKGHHHNQGHIVSDFVKALRDLKSRL